MKDADRFDHHEPCPVCQIKGRDRKGNNLGVYKDGHKYCFSCKYYEPAPIFQRVKDMLVSTNQQDDDHSDTLDFPDDFVLDIPLEPIRWLGKYGIFPAEIKREGFGWSADRQMLIFPIFGDDHRMIAWQGRNFGPTGPKYLTKGPISDILHILGPRDTTFVIVCEDLLSAIKIARWYPAMPLFGSNMPLKTIKRLARRFLGVGVWLDPDKSLEALKTAIRASQYMEAFTVYSSQDPKDYRGEEILEMVLHASSGRFRDKENKKMEEGK